MASVVDATLERVSGFERPVRWGIEIVLVISLALIAARLIWLSAYPAGSVADFTDRPLPSPLAGSAGGLAITVDRSVILRSNPFEADSIEEIITAAPETSLNIQLVGLRMSTGDEFIGNATIRTPQGTAQNFRVGDEIIPGVTLERVLSDRVIINRDGAAETVMREGLSEGLSVIGDESQAVTATGPSRPDSQASAPESLPPITGQIAGPEVLFTAMSIAPEVLADGTRGYRVSPRGSPEIMQQAGFQPGDVLLQFNGTNVDNIDVEELLERIGNVDSAILRINRNGTERTIRLELGG